VGPGAGLDGCGKISSPPTGIRSPNLSAPSESLHRLRSPGPTTWPITRILATDVSFEHKRVRQNTDTSTVPTAQTQIQAHTTLRTHPTYNMSLDSPTVAMPKVGDFVESHHSNHEVEFRGANFRGQTSYGKAMSRDQGQVSGSTMISQQRQFTRHYS